MWIHDEYFNGGPPTNKVPIKSRDHDVYATVLMDRGSRDRSKSLLIRQRTFALDGIWAARGLPEPVRGLVGTVPGLVEETVDDFLEKNREPIDIEPQKMGFPYTLLADSENRRLFCDPRRLELGYLRLRTEFPNTDGLISLSRVGFDRVQRQALVVFGQQFGPRCGHGCYVFLESHDGAWFVVRSTRAWIS